jgi:UDP-N-acetylmuramoylalanine--D-glutamate ligase
VRFSQLDGLTVGVWGAGLETRSFARHLRERLPRARIAVVVLEAPADAPELTDGARVVDAAGVSEALRACDIVVRSPGVSIYRPELAGLTTCTPTGLWMAEREGRDVIGVTATKGKSTTAKLIAHLAGKSGRRVLLGGNIGHPALDFLDDDALAVIELSSYQIADMVAGPEIAMASNVYSEHLQWHGSFEVYRADKLRLLSLPGVKRCVLNATSEAIMAAPRATDDVFLFGAPPGWHVDDAGAVIRGDERFGPVPLFGRHNALNVCGALTALEAAGIPLPAANALEDFENLPHRMQVVHEAGGVTWIDDSISTEPHAARFAVESFPDRPVILIGGGFDRGQDYAELGAFLAARGVRVFALPTTGERLAAAVGASATRVPDLAAAVAAARAEAAPGTVVLLSPAAPSFNTHRNFEARGDEFRELARQA